MSLLTDRKSATPGTGTLPLTLKNFLGYGAGDMANNLAFSLVMTFLTMYFTDVALISPATVGLIFLIMRVVDAVTDLVAGSIIDRTNTRWGKFRPWILVFCVPLAITAVLVFSMPSALHGTGWAIVYGAGTYFLLGSVFYTLVNVPYGSLAAAMTQDPQERAKLATSRSIGAAIMQVGTALAIAPAIRVNADDPAALQSSLTRTVIILAVLAVILHLVVVFTTREQVERTNPKVRLRDALDTLRRNTALMRLSLGALIYLTGTFTTSGIVIYYVRDVYGDAGFLPIALALKYGVVIFIGGLVPMLIPRFGKRRLFILAALCGAVGGLVLAVIPGGNFALAVLGFFLFGLSSGICNLLMWNLEADTIDYGEWKTGTRTEGTTYAVFSFTRKFAQSIGGALGVWIIGWFGYNGAAAVQGDLVETGIRVATGIAPAVLLTITAIVMWTYPLTEKRHAEIVTELKERHARHTES